MRTIQVRAPRSLAKEGELAGLKSRQYSKKKDEIDDKTNVGQEKKDGDLGQAQ